MEYTLAEVNEKLKQFADKMGSDYFPLPVLLNYFHTATYKFVGEKLRILEKNQEVTDDIRSLILPGKLVCTEDPDDLGRYLAGLPTKYLRLVSYDVIYADGTRCRRADLKRQAEYYGDQNNPNKKPTKKYPAITQENNMFYIDAGGVAPAHLKIRYCKKPTFATTADTTARIVNLPDDAIENIILSTVTSLFNKTGDQRVQSNHQLEEAFRKFSQ